MIKLKYLVIFLAGSLVMGSSCTEKKEESQELPNIILITVDDLGWTDLGSFGSTYYETPNIDRIAGEGIKMTNFYASAALCSPTRASIMTGKYPSRVGITDWIRAEFQPGGDVPPDGKNPSGYEFAEGKKRQFMTPVNPLWMELEEVTIAELLNEKGYTTCHIGKWHLGPEGYYPSDQGFDINIGGCDFGEPPSYFDPYNRAPMPEYNYDTIPNIPTLENRKEGEYLTDREAWEAVNFIRNHHDKPFYLNLWHYAVHVPIQAKDSLIRKYENKQKTNHFNPEYAAMIESVDHAAGKILELLDSLDLTENTLIIFTSDNGGLTKQNVTSNDPLRSGKGFPYEGGIRIPFIAKWPGKIEAGTVTEIPAATMDLFPTLCEATGTDIPDSLAIDGKSLLPLLKGESDESLHENLIWYYPHYRDWDRTGPYSIIRKGDFKLIKWWVGDTPYELYNLEEDISETNNLAAQMPEKVKELEDELMNELKATGAQLPKRNPDYKKEN